MPRVLIAAITAATLLMFLGPKFIAWLRANEVGQFVRPPGLIPEGHAEKQGTPTMGGLLIIVATTLPFIILSSRSTEAMLVLFATIACGAIGFVDDFMKLVKKRSLGLSGRIRMVALAGVAAVVVAVAVNVVGLPTTLVIPVLDESFEIGVAAFFVVVFLVVAGAANAVNLTDGLDGLAAGIAAIVLLSYTGIAFVSDQQDLAIFGATLVGACVGFLWFNSFPAAVFMGDTGSYALGGAIAAMAVMTKTEILLVVIGAIFVAEALSVIIQVIVFKRFRRRVFLMTPVHHHFEMAAWSETKIIVRFWLIAAIFAAVGFTLYFRDFQNLPGVSRQAPAPAPAFAPASVGAFRFTGWSADWATGALELGYALDALAFTERYRFPVPDAPLDAARRAALDRAAALLHLVAGVSYFKAAVPPRIEIAGAPPSPATAAALGRLYTGGLGEFAWHNRLPEIGRGIVFPAAPAPPPPASAAGLAQRSLVPVGGGKDSAVALAALVRAGEDVVAFSLGRKPSSDATAAAEGARLVHVARDLDPALLELNRRGAYNGHVPITAIVSCAAVVAALLAGCDAVVMANERSASSGNLEWEEFGGTVNHQYSKGWEAERDLAAAVRDDVAADLRYFSLLRPWSELAIARAFAGLPAHHGTFMSCNRGFRLHGTAEQGWCGDCPKCRFVFLALAPFMPREDLVGVFGRDLLDDRSQEAGFRAVLGIDADKPFECVGEIDEARAALRAAAASPRWAGDALVTRLAPLVGGADPEAAAAWLAPAGEHGIPERHLRASRALLGA